MKSRYVLMSVAVAAMTLISCVKENIDEVSFSEVTLNAVTEGGQTKTALTGFADVVWAAKDQIAVYDGTSFTDFTLSSGAGTASAGFSGTLAAGKTATGAVYPAAAKGDDMSVVNYPAEYAYSEMGVNAPMVASVADGVLQFKHVGGVVKFDVGNIPPAAAGFVFTANSKITGEFAVNAGSVATSGSSADAVKIAFTPGALKSAVFMVPLPTGTYNGFGVKFVDASGNDIAGTAKVKDTYSFTIARKQLLTFPAFVDTTTPSSKVLWEGENVYGNWNNGLQYFAWGGPVPELYEGDVLRFHYTADENGTLVLSNPSDWGQKYTGYLQFSAANTTYDLIVNSDLIALVKENNGFIIEGSKLTLTKIEQITSIDPETVLWTGEYDALENSWDTSFGYLPLDVDKIKAGTKLGCYFEYNTEKGWGNVQLCNNSGPVVAVEGGYGRSYNEIEFTDEVLAKFEGQKIQIVMQYIKVNKIVIK